MDLKYGTRELRLDNQNLDSQNLDNQNLDNQNLDNPKGQTTQVQLYKKCCDMAQIVFD